MKIKFTLIMVCLTLICCQKKEVIKKSESNLEKTRVESFTYGGFGDYVDGTVEFQILDDNRNPLKSNFNLQIDDGIKNINTDEKGFYQTYVKNGTHNLTLSKKNYQSLKILNYISYSDQITTIVIVLVKGTQQQNFESPKWHQ